MHVLVPYDGRNEPWPVLVRVLRELSFQTRNSYAVFPDINSACSALFCSRRDVSPQSSSSLGSRVIMIFLRFWTVAAIVSTGFGHPSPKPPSPKDPSLESPSSQTQDVLGIPGLEEFMQKDPGTAALLLISVGGVSAVATQYLWKGVQEGFGLSRAFRPGRNRCDASEPAKKNDYPDDALVVTPTELANPFSDSDINTLPVRPDLTLQQEALRQGFFQGMKSGGKTRNDLEIWQTLEGFEAGYKEKRKDKLDLDRLRSFKNGITTWKDSAVREAWWRGYEAGFQRAEQAEKSAEKLQANIQKAHHAGVAVGVCVREARYRVCVPLSGMW